MNSFVAIEGISYSGKTTLTSYLQNIGIGIRVPELAELCNDGLEFPDFPSNNHEALASDNWFLRKEIDRMNRYLIPSESIFFLDRSYLSSLAFTYAREKKFGIGSHLVHKQCVNQAVQCGQLPTLRNVILRMDVETYLERKNLEKKKREETLGLAVVQKVGSIMEDIDFVKYMIEFYDKQLENDTGAVYIDAQNTIEENSQIIRGLIK